MTVISLSDRFASNARAASDQSARSAVLDLIADKSANTDEFATIPDPDFSSTRYAFPVYLKGREKLHRRKKSALPNLPALNATADHLPGHRKNPPTVDMDLLINLSHELYKPLRQISAPLEQLQSEDTELSENERKQLYQIIGLHTSRILNLVDQLLNSGQADSTDAPQQDATPETASAEPDCFEHLKTTPTGRRSSSYDDELLEKLFGIMDENLEEIGFNVHKMCGMLHLSHMQFIRKVKQLTGKKPVELLKSYRLKRAKDLLRQNKLTVAQVAYKVGYDMPNSFSRAFKKEFGISPSEYVV